jgi:hypothetical protein
MSRPATHWGERMYDVLVALYPRDFRVRYGPAMRMALRDLLQDPEMPAWRIWFSVLRDLRGSFLHEHLANLTGGISMARGPLLLGALVRRGLAEIRTHDTGTVARLARVAMLTVLIVTPVATGAVGYYLGRSQVSPVAEPALFPESTFAIFSLSTDGTRWTRAIPERICGTSRVGADGMFYWDTRESCGLRRSW